MKVQGRLRSGNAVYKNILISLQEKRSDTACLNWVKGRRGNWSVSWDLGRPVSEVTIMLWDWRVGSVHKKRKLV